MEKYVYLITIKLNTYEIPGLFIFEDRELALDFFELLREPNFVMEYSVENRKYYHDKERTTDFFRADIEKGLESIYQCFTAYDPASPIETKPGYFEYLFIKIEKQRIVKSLNEFQQIGDHII